VARPSSFSEEIAEKILDSLMDGKSLRFICTADDMPHRSTIIRWMSDNADFATRCARAREMQADLMDDLILDTAEETTPENAAASRVKIAAYQWRAAKLAPKRYGDKIEVEHAGRVSLTSMTDEELAAIATGSSPRTSPKA